MALETELSDIASAVAAWAQREPRTIGLLDRDVSLTRGQIWNWATEASDVLRRLPCLEPGEGPPVCALLLPRSWAVPLGIVAARAAGMAFLPLDVRQPPARLGAILAVAQPSAILSFLDREDEALAALAAAGHRADLASIVLEPPHEHLERLSILPIAGGRRLPPGVGHLVFTSGSTGAPKGVMLRDGPLLKTVAAQRALLGTGETEADAVAPSIWALNPAFDASLSDIFCAILGSAPLAVFREEQSRWRSLAAFAARHGASKADIAPSLMRLVSPAEMGIRTVIFGGERCDPATAERWGTETLALQAYGPTEAAVCAMVARAGPGWTEGLLGRPLPHQTVLLACSAGVYRILEATPEAGPDDMEAFNATVAIPHDDAAAQVPMPTSLDGEIWLAGDAVAVGYLDAPKANDLRFGSMGGLPVHRTGDIARWRDGKLVWIGRNDRQVKVNGRLICPEEIEAAAARVWGGPSACLPGPRGLVLALGDPGIHHKSVELEDVLCAVERDLGRAMRPRTAVPVGDWPLTANGKTDLAELAHRVAGERVL